MSQKVLDILLQKNDTRIPWGFSLCSGPDGAILIDKVWPGALACQYLRPGDRLLSMEGIDCSKLSMMDASQIASRPATALNLLVSKATDKLLQHDFSGGSHSSTTAVPVMNRSTPGINWSPPDVNSSTPFTNRSTPVTNWSTPVANRFTPVTNRSVPGVGGDNSQEAWRRRCRQSTSPSSSARRAKAAFWERCTSPQRQRPPPHDNLPEFKSSRSASSGRSTPTRYCSDADLGPCAVSEPDVERRRLSVDWDCNQSVASDSGRGTSYGRQQSCPSWISTYSNSNESLNTAQHLHNSRKLESNASSGQSDRHVNHHEPCIQDSNFSDCLLKTHDNEHSKWLPSKERNLSSVDTQSKTEKEEDLKWFSSQEIKYGYVDSEARTHFEEDSKWPSSHHARFGEESKTQNEREKLELNKQWETFSEDMYSSKNSTSKRDLLDDLKQFSSLPKNFERLKFSSLFDSSEKKEESFEKKGFSGVCKKNLEDYSSQMCNRKENTQESQQSYHRESRSSQSAYNRSTSSSSQKLLESEFEKSFEQFAKMMETGDDLLLKKAEKVITNESDSKQFSEQMSENFNETERRFESYVKDLNATDDASIESNFEKTVLEKTEEVSVTRSHTPAGFYDNHQDVLTEEKKVKVDENLTSTSCSNAPAEVQPVTIEKKPRPASECLDRQGLYDAFNRLRSSSPSDVNETLFRICDVLQTDTRTLADSRRQQSQISGGGNSPSTTVYHESPMPPAPPPPPPMSQGGAPPPPPPPPPLGLVHIPNMRLKTEIPDMRREPPAAIQNAMMTKDKKPFTYTPGGLDLSEIRSPRMQRRINRNAQAEDAPPATTNGVDRPAGQPRPLSMPPGSGAMPQIAIPVFPQAVVGNGHNHHPPPAPPPPPPPQQHWTPPQSAQSPQPMAVPKVQPVQRQVASPVQNTGSIYVPPVQTQSPQPQPPRSQLGSLYVPPVAANNPPPPQVAAPYSPPTPTPYSPSPPTPQLNKSPAPWMSRNSQAQQQAKDVPPWVVVDRETAASPLATPAPTPAYTPNNSYGGQQTRIIPIQIEGRETPQSNTRIIPIQLEASPSPQHNAPQFNYQQQQQQQQTHHQLQQRRPVYVHNKNSPQYANANENSTVDGRSPQGWVGQSDDTASSNPVQSRSFRVLQKITDANNPGEDIPYNSQGVPLSQLRKLQLSDDDRALMNKVKTQVDEEQFLHSESDPRYRGASIPSRAFRMLQNMTEHPGDYMAQVPQGSGGTHVLTNRRPQPQEPTPQPPQPYIPPSEQQVQEPRKYQGGAIPSRSFRILQAMTAGSSPSGCETRENWPEQINNVEGEYTSYPYPYPYYSNDETNNYYGKNGYYYDLNQPPQTPEEQQQFWEHYNAMCAYMAEMNAAAYRYSPFPHAYPPPVTPVPPPPHPLSTHYFSDSDGYSSTDEMAYYGAYFQRRPPPAPLPNYRMFRGRSATPTPAPRIVITPTEHTSKKSDADAECNKTETIPSAEVKANSTELENSSSGSDTEVDDDNNDNDDNARLTGLKTIRSVPDINIYKDSTGSDISSSTPRSDSGSMKEEDDEDDDDEEDYEVEEEVQEEEHFDDDSSLHQLSVIYEESENSSLCSKVGRRDSVVTMASEEDASSATLDNSDDDTDSDDADAIADSDTVTVRLPLKLKFSKASNDRDMATVIVGESEVQPTNEGGQRQSPEKKAQEKIVDDEKVPESLVFNRTEPESVINQKEKSPEIIFEEEINLLTNEESDIEIIEKKEPEGMIVEEITRDDFDADVSVTISLKKPKPKPNIEQEQSIIVKEKPIFETSKDPSERVSSPVDFWKTLTSEDESVSGNEVTARGSISSATEDETRPEESDGHWEDDSSSTSVQTVRTSDATFKPGVSDSDIDDSDDNLNLPCSKEQVSAVALDDENKVEEEEDESDVENENSGDEEDDESSGSSDSTTDTDSESVEGDEEDEVEEREVWKKDSHIMKEFEKSCEKINHLQVDKLVKTQTNHKPGSEVNKDEEQNDESEEDDSGVTSDMSRHISETDTDPECGVSTRKMNSYQRAATHSRLFKLLQEECAQEDEEGSEVPKAPDEMSMTRKDKLTLSLNEQSLKRERDSLSSSSGVDSPSSPNNFDQLAKELVQSLLKRKKGRHFRKLPLAKLHDAAVRILKEDAERCDAVSSPSDESNIYSPVDRVHIPTNRNSGSFSEAYYGDNYHEYCNYYSTWGYPNCGLESINDSLGSDIVPSKTFKMLQEHTTAGQVNSHLIEGLSAKCPRILSSKNVPADLQSCKTPEPSSCDSPAISRVTTPSTET